MLIYNSSLWKQLQVISCNFLQNADIFVQNVSPPPPYTNEQQRKNVTFICIKKPESSLWHTIYAYIKVLGDCKGCLLLQSDPNRVRHPLSYGHLPAQQGVTLFKNSPPDCFFIHPLRCAFVLFRCSLKTWNSDQRLCLWTLPKEHSPFGIPFLISSHIMR